MAAETFKLAAPIVPVLLEQLKEVDPEITGGFLICFRDNGTIAAMTGNTPPSVTVPILKRAIETMIRGEFQLVETAFADESGKAN